MPHTYLETNIHHLKRTLLNDNMTHFGRQNDPKFFLPINCKIIQNLEILLHNFMDITYLYQLYQNMKCFNNFFSNFLT